MRTTKAQDMIAIFPGRHDLLCVEELCSLVAYDQSCCFQHATEHVSPEQEHRARLRDRALGLARAITALANKKVTK